MAIRTMALDFEGLSQLDDGIVAALLRQHLMRATNDCMDRPGDTTARTVTMQFHLTPMVNQRGDCEKVSVEIDCKTKVPTYRTSPYQMQCTKAGLRFNQDFPDSLEQQSLYGGEGGDGEIKPDAPAA